MKVPPGETVEGREWWLYEHALGLVDVQVGRQWSQTQFFILLGVTTIGAGITLVQAGGTRMAAWFAMLVFAAGAFVAFAGIRELANSKRYYRVLVAKKTLLEHRLGLTEPVSGFEGSEVGTYALGGLATRPKARQILADLDAYPRAGLRPGSSASWAWVVLAVLVAFDVLAVVSIGNSLADCWLPVPCSAQG